MAKKKKTEINEIPKELLKLHHDTELLYNRLTKLINRAKSNNTLEEIYQPETLDSIFKLINKLDSDYQKCSYDMYRHLNSQMVISYVKA